MSDLMSTAASIDPAAWPGLSDEDWVALHVPRFRDLRARYLAYEQFIKSVLQEAKSRMAPLAIVEARAKGIASFAEKILRKRWSYVDPSDPLPPDPLLRMTDLCGGRVIAQTSQQVTALCRFIEAAFDIDWPNSEDVSGRLRPREFGYRSVHYIVMPNPEKLLAAGIKTPVPPEILSPRPLKAEVQVRTILEHAWADIGHDMTYKTEVRVPDRIHRSFAALAAVLEGADREFGRLVESLHEFHSNYGAHHSREQVRREIERLRIVLSCIPGNLAQAVRIAQLSMSIGGHETAVDILQPYKDQDHPGVQRVLGQALCEMHWDQPRSAGYLEGRNHLANASAHPQSDAETRALYADSWAAADDTKARELFEQAMSRDASDPLTLCRYLELEVAHHRNDSVVRLATPLVRSAMARCRAQIEGRVNLPTAWSCLALFHLMLREPFAAIEALAQLGRLCRAPEGQTRRYDAPGQALVRLGQAVGRLRCIAERLSGFDWFERLALLLQARLLGDGEAASAIARLASWSVEKREKHIGENDRIIIFSGGCAEDVEPAMAVLRPRLLRACEGLSFTAISGGTPHGIGKLAGDVAEESAREIACVGYLPRLMPRGITPESDPQRCCRLVSSPGADFSPMDLLQAWTDLLAAGIDPARVKLLSYCGGEIARAELVASLALGARCAVIDCDVITGQRSFDLSDWLDHPGLLRIPPDAMTLRAFLLVNELPAENPQFAKAAQRVHEEYLKSARPKEPSLQPWNDLPPILKLSCFHQVAYAENILRTAGLGVRPVADPSRPLLNIKEVLGEQRLRRLAEMEHGRWNVERLLLGWRYAQNKDVAQKLSPYLIPWDALTPEIQQYDIDAICNLPKTFREAGLEVYEL